MSRFSFRDLTVYQESLYIVEAVYELIKKFPYEERSALSSQLRRSVISVPSNIAEGSGKMGYPDKVKYISIAYGSLMETLCQLEISYRLKYISKEEFVELGLKIDNVAKLLSGLKTSFENKQNELSNKANNQ